MLFDSHGIGVGGQVGKGRVWACTQRVATKIGKRMVSREGTNPEKCSCSLQNIQTPVVIALALGMGWMVESVAGKRDVSVFSSPGPLETSFSSWLSSAIFSEVDWGGMMSSNSSCTSNLAALHVLVHSGQYLSWQSVKCFMLNEDQFKDGFIFLIQISLPPEFKF